MVCTYYNFRYDDSFVHSMSHGKLMSKELVWYIYDILFFELLLLSFNQGQTFLFNSIYSYKCKITYFVFRSENFLLSINNILGGQTFLFNEDCDTRRQLIDEAIWWGRLRSKIQSFYVAIIPFHIVYCLEKQSQSFNTICQLIEETIERCH